MGEEPKQPIEDKELKEIVLTRRDVKRLLRLNKRWRNIKSGKLIKPSKD